MTDPCQHDAVTGLGPHTKQKCYVQIFLKSGYEVVTGLLNFINNGKRFGLTDPLLACPEKEGLSCYIKLAVSETLACTRPRLQPDAKHTKSKLVQLLA